MAGEWNLLQRVIGKTMLMDEITEEMRLSFAVFDSVLLHTEAVLLLI